MAGSGIIYNKSNESVCSRTLAVGVGTAVGRLIVVVTTSSRESVSSCTSRESVSWHNNRNMPNGEKGDKVKSDDKYE